MLEVKIETYDISPLPVVVKDGIKTPVLIRGDRVEQRDGIITVLLGERVVANISDWENVYHSENVHEQTSHVWLPKTLMNSERSS